MCPFILLIIFIGFPILINVSFSINFPITFFYPKANKYKKAIRPG